MLDRIKNKTRILPALLLLAGLAGCKKDADFPTEIRASDFWVRYTVVQQNNESQDFEFQGEDVVEVDTFGGIPYPITLDYTSYAYISTDSVKNIVGALVNDFGAGVFGITLRHPDRVTDPFLPPEWTKQELEAVLQPGKNLELGEGPGHASVSLRLLSNDQFYHSYPVNDGTLTILETEDYGSPEANIAYFGKKVHFSFQGTLHRDTDVVTLSRCEAVLFFRYYNY